MTTNLKKNEWDESYKRKDNFVFYPHEEVIRFFSKFIKKRTGFDTFLQICTHEEVRVLDLGCGIGRHVIFGGQMGVDPYGIDLSAEAISIAKEWASREGISNIDEKIKMGSVEALPWTDNFFSFMVSHGVLDSMPYNVARAAVKEASRVLTSDGYFYCDLISGDDSYHSREYEGEIVVEDKFENGTIQNYFNYRKILELFSEDFDFVECKLIRNEDVQKGHFHSRYHVVLKNKK